MRDGLRTSAAALAPSRVAALSFEWHAEAAESLRREHYGGGSPEVILACDCIFAPLFGDAFLLLQMLELLAGDSTTVLLGLERRRNDGAERFFECAEEAGFEVSAISTHARVVLCEMRRRRKE